MLSMTKNALACLVLILLASVAGHGAAPVDVLDYSVTLEPDIAAKSVKGSVLILVSTRSTTVEFDCGALTIDDVRQNSKPLQFSVANRRLSVSLPADKQAREIEIEFHGTPKFGIRFFPDRQQVYTIFSTS